MEQSSSSSNIKFEYDSQEAYLLNMYSKKLAFANYRISRQLDSAIERQKDVKSEVKLFGGALTAILLSLPVAILITMSGRILTFSGIISIIGAVYIFFWILLFWFICPVCVFKVFKGAAILSINKQNAVGRWLSDRLSISVYASEIQSCRKYQRKYELILEDLERWKEELAEGIPVDCSLIERRMEGVDLDPVITVTRQDGGELRRFSLMISIVVTVIIYIVLFLAGKEWIKNLMMGIENTFRQI